MTRSTKRRSGTKLAAWGFAIVLWNFVMKLNYEINGLTYGIDYWNSLLEFIHAIDLWE